MIYTFFALIDRRDDVQYAFIGCTRQDDMGKVYSRYICGEIAQTREYLSKETKFYLLGFDNFTSQEAHNRKIAYVRYFQENGYTVINFTSNLEEAKSLTPEMEEHYKDIVFLDIELILKCTFVEKPSSKNFEVNRKLKKPLQLNIRVTEEYKERFTEFCGRMGVDHTDGFVMLMENTCGSIEVEKTRIINDKDKEIGRLKQKITALEKRLGRMDGTNPTKVDRTSRDNIKLLNEHIGDYLWHLIDRPSGASLPGKSYKEFKRYVRGAKNYRYPSGSGCMLIAATMILWGGAKNNTAFLIGRNVERDYTPVMFRFYPKGSFIGVNIRHPVYAKENIHCWVCYAAAEDGAADIIAAMPKHESWNQRRLAYQVEAEEQCVLLPRKEGFDYWGDEHPDEYSQFLYDDRETPEDAEMDECDIVDVDGLEYGEKSNDVEDDKCIQRDDENETNDGFDLDSRLKDAYGRSH